MHKTKKKGNQQVEWKTTLAQTNRDGANTAITGESEQLP